MTTLSAAERVVELMRTFDEARVSYAVGSTGNGVRLMPSQWHEGSYAELERALIALRDSRRRPLWWHACQRYRWGRERTIIAPVVRRRRGPEFVLPLNCELVAGGPAIGSRTAYARVYEWSPLVDHARAAEGVDTLVETMYDGRYDRIMLPRLVFQRKLGLPIKEREEAVA